MLKRALQRVRAEVADWAQARPRRRDALVLFGVALALRFALVAWAGGRFPPIDDGSFYHVVAQRIARGLGYTWSWPDGAVTYAAHYPVGYPALVGLGYFAFGPSPVVAMSINAVLGAAAVYAVHELAAASGSRLAALVAGAIAALHPGLLLYTPALMTEGVAAAVIACAAYLCAWAARRGRAALLLPGLALGASVLIRPQLILAAPFLALLASPRGSSWRRRLGRAGVVCALSIAACLPWTARNCQRLESCVFVSANGGWNLLIGTARQGQGHFIPLDVIGVPSECREVFGEADKDRCFGQAGLRKITNDPLSWLSLAPLKLMRTFEYAGAAGYYLHASNGTSFEAHRKEQLAVVETAFQRLVLILALFGVARAPGPWRRGRVALASFGMLCALLPAAWIAYTTFVLAALALRARLIEQPSLLAAASVVGTTAFTHAVFFGEGRYGLVVFPLLGAAAGLSVIGSRAEAPGGEP